jgi:hypothetical protein
MINENELVVAAQQHIGWTNENFFKQAKKDNISVYGNIADLIEGRAEGISLMAEEATRSLLQYNDIRLKKNFEKNSTLFERIISNDNNRLAKYNIIRDSERTLIENGIPWAIHLVEWGVHNGMMAMEKRKVYKNIWFLAHIYAYKITHGNIEDYRPVENVITAICNDTIKKNYPALDKDPKICPTSLSDLEEKHELSFPKEEGVQENIAFILYMLYAQKHDCDIYENEKHEDLLDLINCWFVLGYTGDYGKLFQKFERIGAAKMPEFNRNVQTLQGIYHNLMMAFPSIDHSLARRLDRELLSYIPNGDTQAMARRGGKILLETGIVTAGVISQNPVMYKVGAKAAVSLFKDLGQTELIGNVLNASGIQEDDVREIIMGARKIQKQMRPEIE